MSAELPLLHACLDSVVKTNRRRAHLAALQAQDVAWAMASERALAGLDETAWQQMKARLCVLLNTSDPASFWDLARPHLNEARAYAYLKALGCSEIRFLPHTLTKGPDLAARRGAQPVVCEVKTLRLSRALARKIDARLADAEAQLAAVADGAAWRLIYLVADAPPAFLGELRAHLARRPPGGTEIVLDPGFTFA